MEKHESMNHLEHTFREFYKIVQSDLAKNLERETISASQAFILQVLFDKGIQKVSELSEALGISLSAVTSLCDKMISSKLVERKRTEEDRRVVLVRITDSGIDMLNSIKSKRKELFYSLFGSLSEEDIHHLIRIFEQINMKGSVN